MSEELPESDSVATGLPDQPVMALILGSIFVDLLVTAVEHPGRGPSGPLIFVKSALASSQLGLLGVWLGLGEPLVSPRRVMACCGAVLAWFLAFAGLSFEQGSLYGLVTFSALPATVAGGFCVARTTGLRLRNVRDQCAAIGVAPARFQFSLRQMFVWTTIVAVVMTLLVLLLPVLGGVLMIGIPVLLGASLTWTAVWAMLGRTMSWRPAVLCLVPIALMAVLFIVFGPPSSFPWTVAVLLFLHCLFTAGSLAVFRACGYRAGR